ncbi:hypothetical protein D3C86_1036650 [compost metagenome]
MRRRTDMDTNTSRLHPPESPALRLHKRRQCILGNSEECFRRHARALRLLSDEGHRQVATIIDVCFLWRLTRGVQRLIGPRTLGEKAWLGCLAGQSKFSVLLGNTLSQSGTHQTFGILDFGLLRGVQIEVIEQGGFVRIRRKEELA